MSNWFASWFDSEYYHLLYSNRDESEAKRFIENILNYLQLPQGSKVLDIACGKGRHAKAINKKGYDVIGIDLSENSIKTANEMATENLQFFVHDMREPFRENEFDAAFNFFTSFGYFDTEADNEKAAASFAAGVKQGGLLLIDFVNKAHAVANITARPKEELKYEGVHFEVDRLFEAGRYKKLITVCDIEHCSRHEESLQSLTKEDFVRYFTPQGMKLETVFGDYNLNEYDQEHSPRLILLFRKK